MIGFLSRRNMIVMFLSAEIMLQGVSLSLVAWSRFRNDFGGQMLVVFIIAVAACEAAVALALVVTLFRRPRQSRHRRLAACCAKPTSRRSRTSGCRKSRPSGPRRRPICRRPAWRRRFPGKRRIIDQTCNDECMNDE